MKIDFSAQIKDLDGNPVMEKPQGDKDKGVPLTLGMVACNVLLTMDRVEKDLPAKDKIANYELARDIHRAESPLDLKSEEITKLKTYIGRVATTLVVGCCEELLEGGTIETVN